MATKNLTKELVAALCPRPDKRVVICDSELHGFRVVVSPAGRKTFALWHRNKLRQPRFATLGTFPTIGVQQARLRARDMLAQVQMGGDPVQELATKKTAPTFDALCDYFRSSYLPTHVKPTTARQYSRMVERALRPQFGKMRVQDLTRHLIREWHAPDAITQ